MGSSVVLEVAVRYLVMEVMGRGLVLELGVGVW